MTNNFNITSTLIKVGANLNIVDALGHTPGFYGFKFCINYISIS
jgi:hypothetical protein